MPRRAPVFSFLPPRPKAERDRAHDTRRRAEKPWRRWYYTNTWKAIRRRQLTNEPYCRRCDDHGKPGVPATTVNHIVPHRGVYELFLAGPFESLCAPCHSGPVQRQERREADRIP